ncbi:hypothetical protein PLEOSDRAFT_1090448 [Pleurotus ostreatus PC15]|uniref:Uncharacterized protein n=1 Tax=Pleurotus ostreatus (strain PC15) TaxID=1137138 RepID=A0A067NL04_PLEO1|nr:hypothetical protein PLEOSDRAFT_1090448 [Pleurotus ostreatus PC15]
MYITTCSAVTRRGIFAARRQAAVSGRRQSSTMHDNDPDVLDLEKKRNLSGTQHKTSTPHTNAPGWNEHLATASEASVKADRSDSSPEDMQRTTVEYIHSRHAPDERTEPTSAFYSYDTVDGPLGAGADKILSKRTVHEEVTEVLKKDARPTDSEANVKADRGEL